MPPPRPPSLATPDLSTMVGADIEGSKNNVAVCALERKAGRGRAESEKILEGDAQTRALTVRFGRAKHLLYGDLDGDSPRPKAAMYLLWGLGDAQRIYRRAERQGYGGEVTAAAFAILLVKAARAYSDSEVSKRQKCNGLFRRTDGSVFQVADKVMSDLEEFWRNSRPEVYTVDEIRNVAKIQDMMRRARLNVDDLKAPAYGRVA